MRVSTPIGEACGVIIWLFFSTGDSRLHGLWRLLSFWLSLAIVGWSVSRTLSMRDVGRLISVSVRSESTSLERGDLERRMDLCACFGVIVVLVDFSLEIGVCILIPAVEGYHDGVYT